MTRILRTTLAVLAILMLPLAAAAQEKAAEAQPAEDAKPAEEAKPTPPPPPALPSVLTKLNVTFYGYVNFDAIYDTTRSFNFGMGNDAVAREGTQNGDESRTIFGAGNSRFGFRVAAPEFQGIKASGLLETDFGQLVNAPSESNRYSQGLLRLRQANVKLETAYVDVIMGQTTYLFGWQSSFFPATAAMLGIPGEPFGRTPQLRLSKLFKTDLANFEVAAGAFRPPQRDAGMPEIQGGVRAMFNGWKGIHSLGAGGTGPYPLSVGVSGATRRFVAGFKETATSPKYKEKALTGNAVSFDVLVPIIPTRNGEKGNKLSLVATYAITKGAGDLLGGITGGGKPNPAVPEGAAEAVLPDVGTVVYTPEGDFKLVNWTGLVVGADYYLPPGGRFWISATYSMAKSDNVADWATEANKPGVYTQAIHYDANLFCDVTPAVRLGASWQHRQTKYADGEKADTDRYHFTAYYNF